MHSPAHRALDSAVTAALAITLLAAPSLARAQREDESLRSGDKTPTRTVTPPLSVRNVATTLRTMGRDDLADRFLRDYASGKVRLGDPGSRALTDPPIIIPLVTNRKHNIMTLDKKELEMTANTVQTDRNPVSDGTLGWALTVVHEYVHMEQDNPTQTPRFENAGWREAINENQNWIRRVMNQVYETRGQPNSPEKVARLRELNRQLELLRGVHEANIASLHGEINAGSVRRGMDWPTIEAGSSEDLDGIVRSANTLVATSIKNTRDDIARIEKEIGTVATTEPRAPTPPGSTGVTGSAPTTAPAAAAPSAPTSAPATDAPSGPRIQDTKYFVVEGHWDYTSQSGTYGLNLLSDRQGQLIWEGNRFSFSYTTPPDPKAQTKVTKTVSFQGQLSPDGARMEQVSVSVKTTYADRGRVYLVQDEALAMRDIPRTWTPDSRTPFGDKKDEYRYSIERPDDAKARLSSFWFKQVQGGQTIEYTSLFTFRGSKSEPAIKIAFGRQPVY